MLSSPGRHCFYYSENKNKKPPYFIDDCFFLPDVVFYILAETPAKIRKMKGFYYV